MPRTPESAQPRQRPLIRPAEGGDAVAIARLHAESWRRHYRGAYADRFLDGDLDRDRLTVWAERLSSPKDALTLVADASGSVVGFVHVQLDDDSVWGALVDNLHVSLEWQRAGVGTRLLAAAQRGIREQRVPPNMYLWVLEQNTRARAFYRASGGRFEGRAPVPPPCGDPRNLVGQPYGIRVVWREVDVLSAD